MNIPIFSRIISVVRAKRLIQPFVCVIILWGMFATTTLAHVEHSYNSIQSKQGEYLSLLTSLLDSDIPGGSTLTELEMSILKELEPITSVTLTGPIIRPMVQELFIDLREWRLAITPLLDYDISPEGFVHRFDANRLFTDDLEVVIENTRVLYQDVKSRVDDITFFSFISVFTDRFNVYFSLLSELITIGDFVYENSRSILRLLGHFGEKRIGIFNQNIGESRPTGGFYGSYIPVRIDKGRVTIDESQSIFNVTNQKTFNVLGIPQNSYIGALYGETLLSHLDNLQSFPCFSYTAEAFEDAFSRYDNGFSMDSVVFITPQLLKQLLPKNTSFTVPGYGAMNTDTLLNEIERQTVPAFEAKNISNPKEAISPILKEVVTILADSISLQSVQDLLISVVNSFDARYIQTWFKDTEIQQFANTLGITGNAACQDETKQAIISPFTSNYSGDKRYLASEQIYSIDTTSVLGGTQFTITYDEEILENIKLQRITQQYNSFTFLGLQVPANAYNVSVTGDGIATNIGEQVYDTQRKQRYEPDYTYEYALYHENVYNSLTVQNNILQYHQPDGSKVFGAFVNNTPFTPHRYSFSFTLPLQHYDSFTFVGQAGQQDPTVFWGTGVTPHKKNYQAVGQVGDPIEIGSGVDFVIL